MLKIKILRRKYRIIVLYQIMKKNGIAIIILITIMMASFGVTANADDKDWKDKPLLKSETTNEVDLTKWDKSFLNTDITLHFEGTEVVEKIYPTTINGEKMEIGITDSNNIPEYPAYNGNADKYSLGDIVSYDNKNYICTKNYNVKNNKKTDIDLKYWIEYESVTGNVASSENSNKNGNGNNDTNKTYVVYIKDGNGIVIKTTEIQVKGSFKIADLNLNINDYIDASIGYDIDIRNNDRTVIISAAPTMNPIIQVIPVLIVLGIMIKRKDIARQLK